MPHGYSKQQDTDKLVLWRKHHNNGEKTDVQIDKVGTKASGGEQWLANVKDPRGSERLGKFVSKTEAKTAAKNWMKQNPKGAQSGPANGGFIPGANGAQQSNDFWG